MTELPMVMFWNGKRADDMTREELLELVGELGCELRRLREAHLTHAREIATLWRHIACARDR